jgi:hypothetical protein
MGNFFDMVKVGVRRFIVISYRNILNIFSPDANWQTASNGERDYAAQHITSQSFIFKSPPTACLESDKNRVAFQL